MLDLAAFLTSSVAGNLLLQVAGEGVYDFARGPAAALWDRLGLGSSAFDAALATAWRQSFSALQLMLVPPEGLREALGGLVHNPDELRLAGEYAAKTLTPFLFRNSRVLGSRGPEFLVAAREACCFLQDEQERILTWTLLMNAWSGTPGRAPASSHAGPVPNEGRETFDVLSAVLYAGDRLAPAPDLDKAMRAASEALIARIRDVAHNELRRCFAFAPGLERLFYDLLGERVLLVSALTWFLDREIRSRPQVAAALHEHEARVERVERMEDNSRQERRNREMMHSLEELRAEIREMEERIASRHARNLPVKSLELDLGELRQGLIPLQERFDRLDEVAQRIESWNEYHQRLSVQWELLRQAFGRIAGNLGEIASRLRQQEVQLAAIGNDVSEMRDDLRDVRRDTVGMKAALGELLAVKSWERLEQKYEVLGTVGRGQFGIVLQVRSRLAGEIRALKVLRSDAASDADIRRRFMNEACTASELDHPHIVKVFDVDPIGSFFEMEFLAGKTLRQVIQSYPVGVPRAVIDHLLPQLLSALEYLHTGKRLAHRDLKPENLMLVPDAAGRLVLTDLGAITHLDVVQETLGKGLAGTAVYMAPEQFEGEKSPQIDIYALGVILYEMVCGVPPFSGGNFIEIRQRHVAEPPTPPSMRGADVDGTLETLILRCLKKSPRDRFASIAEAGAALTARSGETERERQERSQREALFIEALKLVWIDGVKTVEEQTMLEQRRREWKIEAARAAELEEAICRIPEIARNIESHAQRESVDRRNVFILLLRAIWRKGVLDPADQTAIEEERIRLGLSVAAAAGLQAVVCSEPAIQQCIQGARERASQAPRPPAKPPDFVSSATGFGGGAGTATSAPSDDRVVPDGERITARNAHRLKEWRRLGAGRVTQALLARDRNAFAVAAATRILLYDFATHARIGQIETGSWICSLAWSSDGKRLASGGRDHLVRIWDQGSGKEMARGTGHSGEVSSIVFSHDAKKLASGSWDGTVRIWEVGSASGSASGVAPAAACLRILQPQGTTINAVAFSPDDRLLAVACWNGSVRIYRAEDGELVAALDGSSQTINALAWFPDGERLAAAGADRTLRCWNVARGVVDVAWDTGAAALTALAVTPDGGFVLSGSSDKSIRVFRADTGEETARLHGHRLGVQSLSLAADNRYLVSTGTDGAALIWDCAEGRPIRSLQGHPSQVRAMVLGEGPLFLAAGEFDGTIRVWDPREGLERSRNESHVGQINALVRSPDGRLLASGGADRQIRLWRISETDGTLREVRRLIGHTDWVNAMAFLPDGKTLISAGNDSLLRLWDIASGKEKSKLEGHEGRINALSITPDGRHVVSASRDGTVRLWDLATGEELRRISGITAGVASLALADEGRFVLCGTGDGQICVYGLATGKLLKRLLGHAGSVTSLAASFSGEHQLVVSGGMDKTVRVWDFARDRELKKLEGHADLVNALLLTLGGEAIVSASWDGTLRFWAL